MEKENLIYKVFSQLTEEHLEKIAADIITNNQLQYYLIIDHDGVVWITYSLFLGAGRKPRYRRDGEEYYDKELFVVELPNYSKSETSSFSKEKIKEEVEDIVYEIKRKIMTAINWAVTNNVPANYWD